MDETFEGGATVTAKLKVWYVKVHRSASGMPLCRGRSAADSTRHQGREGSKLSIMGLYLSVLRNFPALFEIAPVRYFHLL